MQMRASQHGGCPWRGQTVTVAAVFVPGRQEKLFRTAASVHPFQHEASADVCIAFSSCDSLVALRNGLRQATGKPVGARALVTIVVNTIPTAGLGILGLTPYATHVMATGEASGGSVGDSPHESAGEFAALATHLHARARTREVKASNDLKGLVASRDMQETRLSTT